MLVVGLVLLFFSMYARTVKTEFDKKDEVPCRYSLFKVSQAVLMTTQLFQSSFL